MPSEFPTSIVLLITPFRDGVAYRSPTPEAFMFQEWTKTRHVDEALEAVQRYVPAGTEITMDRVVTDLPTPLLGDSSEDTDGVYAADGVHIRFGGACPIQGEGELDGFGVYYRSRGTRWSLEVMIGEDAPWEYGETKYVWPEAGWLHQDETVKNLERAVAEFRARPRLEE